MQYGLAQAEARLSELTHLVDAGQEGVIARHGRPGCRLVATWKQHAQNYSDSFVEQPPGSLDDMADLLANLRRKSRLPEELDFVAQRREGARY